MRIVVRHDRDHASRAPALRSVPAVRTGVHQVSTEEVSSMRTQSRCGHDIPTAGPSARPPRAGCGAASSPTLTAACGTGVRRRRRRQPTCPASRAPVHGRTRRRADGRADGARDPGARWVPTHWLVRPLPSPPASSMTAAGPWSGSSGGTPGTMPAPMRRGSCPATGGRVAPAPLHRRARSRSGSGRAWTARWAPVVDGCRAGLPLEAAEGGGAIVFAAPSAAGTWSLQVDAQFARP